MKLKWMMQQAKYKLTRDIEIRVGQKKLYAVQALRDFADVSDGDIGGFVESEANLSHEGDCWIYDSALVYEKARVDRNAKVKDQANIYGNSKISDDALVTGQTNVFQNAMIYDEAIVDGISSVYGNAQVFGKVQILGHSKVHDDAWVYGDFIIDGYANITCKTTQRPIVLTGFTYDVTIMDEHISIDCQTKTFDEWRKVTREEVIVMNGKEGLRFFNHTADTLEFLVSKYRKNQSNV